MQGAPRPATARLGSRTFETSEREQCELPGRAWGGAAGRGSAGPVLERVGCRNHQGGASGVARLRERSGEVSFGAACSGWAEGSTKEEWHLPALPSPLRAGLSPDPPALTLKLSRSFLPLLGLLPLCWSLVTEHVSTQALREDTWPLHPSFLQNPHLLSPAGLVRAPFPGTGAPG